MPFYGTNGFLSPPRVIRSPGVSSRANFKTVPGRHLANLPLALMHVKWISAILKGAGLNAVHYPDWALHIPTLGIQSVTLQLSDAFKEKLGSEHS